MLVASTSLSDRPDAALLLGVLVACAVGLTALLVYGLVRLRSRRPAARDDEAFAPTLRVASVVPAPRRAPAAARPRDIDLTGTDIDLVVAELDRVLERYAARALPSETGWPDAPASA